MTSMRTSKGSAAWSPSRRTSWSTRGRNSSTAASRAENAPRGACPDSVPRLVCRGACPDPVSRLSRLVYRACPDAGSRLSRLIQLGAVQDAYGSVGTTSRSHVEVLPDGTDRGQARGAPPQHQDQARQVTPDKFTALADLRLDLDAAWPRGRLCKGPVPDAPGTGPARSTASACAGTGRRRRAHVERRADSSPPLRVSTTALRGQAPHQGDPRCR